MMHRNIRGWMLVLAAATAAFVFLGASISPVRAQSGDPGGSSSSSSSDPGAPAYPYRAFLPLLGKPPNTVLGVQIYSNLDSPNAKLSLAKQGRISWVRWPVAWAGIEPNNTNPPTYYFSPLDAAISAARSNDLSLIITVISNPSWAATQPDGPIDKVSVSRFAQFMSAFVERYDGDGYQDAPGSPVVTHFEFYNEPDNGTVSTTGDGIGHWGKYGAQYAQMLCAVYPAMKNASPKAQIVMGGMAYDWWEEEDGPFVKSFLDNVLAAGGGQCLDVMAFHYYPAFEDKWETLSTGYGLNAKANYIRQVLANHNAGGLAMMVTEAGHHSNDYPTWPSSPSIQADYAVKLLVQSMASRLRTMIWWTWSDFELQGSGVWGKNGLLDDNLQPKLSYYAYQTAAFQLGSATFERILSAGEIGNANVQAYLFQRGAPFYVLWSTYGSQNVILPGGLLRVTDRGGNVVGTVADGADGVVDGKISMTIGSSPRYVEVLY